MNDERLLRHLRCELADAGLHGGLLVRNLDTGAHIGIDPDLILPIASLVKVPLALAVLERIENGSLDGARILDVEPGRVVTPGPMGIARFRHPARVAVDDLLYLAVAVSDNSAADALLDLVPIDCIRQALESAGVHGLEIRHGVRELSETPAEVLDPADRHLAHALAIGSRNLRSGHPVRQLDIARANAGSATAFVDLLSELWRPQHVTLSIAERMRALLGANVLRHRLTPELASDSAVWSSKTGTLLNLRHEIGVVDHESGPSIAIAAMTESSVPAVTQPAAEAVLSSVVRVLHDRVLEY